MRFLLALLLLSVTDQGLATALRKTVHSLVGKKLSSSMAIVNKINEVDEDGRNALHHAIMLSDLSLVEFFLVNGANTKAIDNNNLIPLRYASRLAGEQPSVERMKIASLVLEKTRGMNKGDEKGWPPLTWSVFAGDYARIIELRDRGADIFAGRFAYPNRGQLAGRHNAVWAAEHLEDDRAIEILAKGAPDRYFPVAVGNGYRKFTQAMIAQGVDVNVRDRFGYSAAMRAAKAGRLDDLRMLIENGAKIDSKVLFFAIYSGNPKLVEEILEHDVGLIGDLVVAIMSDMIEKTVQLGHARYLTVTPSVGSVFRNVSKSKGGRRIIRMIESMGDEVPFTSLVKLVQQHLSLTRLKFADLADKRTFSRMEQEVRELLSYLIGTKKFYEDAYGYRQLVNFLVIANAGLNDDAVQWLLELLDSAGADKEKLVNHAELLGGLTMPRLQGENPDDEAFFQAIMKNDIESIQRWIDFGLRIDNRHIEVLAKFGTVESLEIFIDREIISVDHLFPSNNGRPEVSLLLKAAWGNNFSVVEKIISLGSKAGIDRALIHFSNSFDRYDNFRVNYGNPFYFNKQVLAMMELLIDNGADANSEYNAQSPLYNAITSLEVPRVKLLLERGAVVGDIRSALTEAGYRATRSDDKQLDRDLDAIERLLANHNLREYRVF